MRKVLIALLAVACLFVAGCSSSSDSSSSSSGGPSSAPGTAAASGTSSDTGSAEDTGATDGTATVPTKPFTGKDFYAVPDPLPKGPHGTLLRFQEVKGPDDATTYRIMYLSESVAGEPIVVTGDASVPTAAAPDGGRRVITVAHGTSGIADTCAPSTKDEMGAEARLLDPLTKLGYLVVATDYEGLGTPGRHPYLVGESEGRSVIDGVLAAGSLPNADAGKDVGIMGYSQGGHGALWANQVAAEWAPDLNIVGTFAGAPATELDIIANAASNLPGASGFFILVAAGFNAAYPDAKLDQVLTPAGIEILDDTIDTGCVGDTISASLKEKPADLVKPGVLKVQPWADLLKANNPGQVTTDDPILIVHSESDDVVPIALSGILFNRLCGLGQNVSRVVLDEKQGHIEAAPKAYTLGIAWMTERFDGKPAVSTCPPK